MLAKAATIDVDEVVIDFEDAVAVSHKNGDTRSHVVDAVMGTEWSTRSIVVRVNGLSTPWFEDDVRHAVAPVQDRISGVVLPMVESANDVVEALRLLDSLVGSPGDQAPIRLQAMIESALGVVRVEDIAASSSRLTSLVFGPGDYAASMSLPFAPIGAIDDRYPGDQWAYPRGRVAVAAHAFGLDPIDGPYARFRDEDGLVESANRARLLGFTGKWVIHPTQIPPCIAAFSPSDEERARRQAVGDALVEARGRGDGATSLDGVMLDAASDKFRDLA